MKNKKLGVCLFWLVGFPSAVLAQRPASVECESNPACVLLYEHAQQQSKAGQLSAALNSYKLAYGVNQDPRLLFSIARVLDKTDQVAEAITYYQQFIDSAVEDGRQKDKAREYLVLLKAKQQQLTVTEPPKLVRDLPTASLTVPSSTVAPIYNTAAAVPVYKQRWFWGVLIGSAAAVGLSVGLGAGLRNRTPTLAADVNTFDPIF